MIQTIFSEHLWLPWKFQSVPNGYWAEKTNQRYFLDWLIQQLKIETIEDLYKVTVQQIHEHGGRGLLRHYNDSPSFLISSLFPEYFWLPWQFHQAPLGFWANLKNQRLYLEWLANRLEITNWQQWYDITIEQITENEGGGLLSTYNACLSQLFPCIFPENPWLVWRFSQLPRDFWSSVDNQKLFLEWMARDLQLNNLEDWYYVHPAEISNRGGGRLLSKYQDSMFRMLSTVYNHYPWVRHMAKYFDWFCQQNNLTGPEKLAMSISATPFFHYRESATNNDNTNDTVTATANNNINFQQQQTVLALSYPGIIHNK